MATQVEIKGLADFTQATKSLNNFTKSASKGFDSIKTTIASVGVAFGAIAGAVAFKKIGSEIQGLVQDFANLGDNVAKTADKIGVGVEALQELRFAADRTGVPTQTLDKALQSLARKAAEAGQGLGEARGVFEQLGITVFNAEGSLKSTETLLGELSNSLGSIPDQGEKVRIAFKLFEAEGVGLLNTIGKGNKELQALRNEFKSLGGVIREDAARASENFIDSQTNLGVAIRGITNSIASQLLPVFTKVIIGITEFIKKNKQLVTTSLSAVINAFLSLAKIAAGIAFKTFPILIEGVNFIIKSFINLGRIVRFVIVNFFDFFIVEKIIEAVIRSVAGLGEVLTFLVKNVLSIGKLFPSVFSTIGIDINAVTDSLQGFEDGLKNVRQNFKGETISDGLKAIDSTVTDVEDSVIGLGKGVKNLSVLASKSFDAISSGSLNASTNTKKQIDNIDALTSATQRLTKEQEIQAREATRKQVEGISTNPILFFTPQIREDELLRLAPLVRAQVELELKKVEGISALTGAFNTALKGASGALAILKTSVSTLVETLLPGLGKVVGEIFEGLSKTPEEVKKLIGEFFTAIPTIIQSVLVNVGTLLRAIFENIGPLLDGLLTAIVEGFFSLTDLIVDIPEIILNALLQIDQFIIKLIDAVPLFIDRLINEIPRIIEALVEASPALIVKLNSLMPLVAVKFATSLIANLPTIVFEFAKSFITEGIPAIVKGFIDSFKDAFNGLFDALKQAVPEPIRKVFGFQEGGLVKGFGSKDSIPAMLAPNELVVDRSLTDKLESFLNESSVNQRLASGGRPQNLTINLTVGEEQLASVMVALTQKGFRIA